MIEQHVSEIAADKLLSIAIAHARLAAQHPDLEKNRFLVKIAASHLERVLEGMAPPPAA